VQVLDLPGTYSLAARSPDEMVAVDVLLGLRADTPRPDAVVVVVDAANLERNLYLATQVLEAGRPVVVALNMADDARRRGIEIDAGALAGELGVAVVPTVANRGEGIDRLRAAVVAALDGAPPEPRWGWPEAYRLSEATLSDELAAAGHPDVPPVELRRAILDVGGEAERRLVRRAGAAARRSLDAVRAGLERAGVPLAGLEAGVRYGYIGEVVSRTVRRPAAPRVTTSDRIDAVLTHRVWGTAVFVVLMTGVFLSIFSWAEPLMVLIDEGVFGTLKQAVAGWDALGDGVLKSLLVDGVISGVGGVLVFLPQILILFGFIAILEGCGYMARAAFLMDRLLRWCGLSGRSFIPMLSSFACAVPGIMAARTIESRRDRIATILVAPLMSCSARIPVYVILTAAFVPAALQGVVFASMYLVGIVVAIPVAFVLKKTLLRGDTPSFLVELPPYRVPSARVVLHRMLGQGRTFVVRAGTLILAASVVVWALSTWPRRPEPDAAAVAAAERLRLERDVEEARQRQALDVAREMGGPVAAAAAERFDAYLAAKADEERAEANAAEGERLRHSALGTVGKFLEPVFAPIGWDWKVGMAVVASFPAREVVVSTLGVIYNLGAGEDEESMALRDRLKEATWEDGPRKGRPVFDLASALALMVFFALCAQCASTLVTIWKETGTWGWAAFTFAYMTTLAWLAAWLTAVVVRAVA
jgi:ferrous iron transport protein B